jgi:ATP-dependent DNA helicase PIF1
MTQLLALAVLDAGHNVFLTGPAGSGKTYVLNQFIKDAKRIGKSVAVTASTGLAATHLGGTTIHAWSGIGIHDELPRNLLSDMSKSRRDLISGADILVIDEVSMLHDFRLDLIDIVCRSVRGNKHVPFGGLQVVLCGDFYQLPPVNRNDSRQGGFVTNADAWKTLEPVICYLSEQHRQSEDELLEILTAMRANDLRRRHAEALLARQIPQTPFDEPVTELYTRNFNVDSVNNARLKNMPGDVHEYEMTSTGRAKAVESLKKSCLAPEVLALKEGAFVMFVKNSLEKKYVNGTLGTVVGFEKANDYPIVLTKDGKTITAKPDTWEVHDGDRKLASLAQIPLRLAWAITVHKSQGMTLDAAHMDLRDAFVPGMGYVALSRVRSLDTLTLKGINKMALTMSAEAHDIDVRLRESSLKDEATHSELEKAYVEKVEKQKLAKPPKIAPKTKQSWDEKLEKMREKHPNAYKPWKKLDDNRLMLLWEKSKSLSDMSTSLGRHEGSIKARLTKLLEREMPETW